MRRIHVFENVTLDGVTQGPAGPEEDFAHGWSDGPPLARLGTGKRLSEPVVPYAPLEPVSSTASPGGVIFTTYRLSH